MIRVSPKEDDEEHHALVHCQRTTNLPLIPTTDIHRLISPEFTKALCTMSTYLEYLPFSRNSHNWEKVFTTSLAIGLLEEPLNTLTDGVFNLNKWYTEHVQNFAPNNRYVSNEANEKAGQNFISMTELEKYTSPINWSNLLIDLDRRYPGIVICLDRARVSEIEYTNIQRESRKNTFLGSIDDMPKHMQGLRSMRNVRNTINSIGFA